MTGHVPDSGVHHVTERILEEELLAQEQTAINRNTLREPARSEAVNCSEGQLRQLLTGLYARGKRLLSAAPNPALK